MKNRLGPNYERLENLTEQPGNMIPLDRCKCIPSFNVMVIIVFGGVDFDNPTTNMRGRSALAITKPTPRGY